MSGGRFSFSLRLARQNASGSRMISPEGAELRRHPMPARLLKSQMVEARVIVRVPHLGKEGVTERDVEAGGLMLLYRPPSTTTPVSSSSAISAWPRMPVFIRHRIQLWQRSWPTRRPGYR